MQTQILYILLLIITIALTKLKHLTRLDENNRLNLNNNLRNVNEESSDDESAAEQIFFPEILEEEMETPRILFNNNYTVIQNSDMIEIIRASSYFLENINHLQGLWEHPNLPITALTAKYGSDDTCAGVRRYFQHLILEHSNNSGTLKIPIIKSINTFKETLEGRILTAGLDGDLINNKEEFVNSFLEEKYKTINVERFLSAYYTSDLQRLDVVTSMLVRAYSSPDVTVEVNPLRHSYNTGPLV